jgi:hypothetical protein
MVSTFFGMKREVGTCLYLYLSSIAGDVSPVKKLTFYSDTCGGQNRNKFVVAALHYTSEQFVLFDVVHIVNILNIDLSLDTKMKSCTEY